LTLPTSATRGCTEAVLRALWAREAAEAKKELQAILGDASKELDRAEAPNSNRV
jgi:hypothetical protein